MKRSNINAKKLIPDDINSKKFNNYLYFKYPYVFLWREEDKVWFPLPTDRFTEDEIASVKKFIENKYLLMNVKSLSREELADDLSIYMKGLVSPENLQLIHEFICAATLQEDS